MKKKLYNTVLKTLACLILLSGSQAVLSAQTSPNRAFENGNAFYAKGIYDSALIEYQTAHQSGYEAWELYFNMGNAYYNQGEYPDAILYYEKALKLEPKQEDAQNNLALAELKIVDRFESMPTFALTKAWQNFTQLFPMQVWAALILAFMLCCLLCALLYRTSKSYSRKQIGFYALLLSILLFVFSFIAGGSAYHQSKHKYAIVMQEAVPLQDMPEASSPSSITLHEGSKVSIEDEIPPYYQVRIKDGSKGWIPISAVEII